MLPVSWQVQSRHSQPSFPTRLLPQPLLHPPLLRLLHRRIRFLQGLFAPLVFALRARAEVVVGS